MRTDAEYLELARDIIAKHSTIDVAALDLEVQRERERRNMAQLEGTPSLEGAEHGTLGGAVDGRKP